MTCSTRTKTRVLRTADQMRSVRACIRRCPRRTEADASRSPRPSVPHANRRSRRDSSESHVTTSALATEWASMRAATLVARSTQAEPAAMWKEARTRASERALAITLCPTNGPKGAVTCRTSQDRTAALVSRVIRQGIKAALVRLPLNLTCRVLAKR